MKNEYNSVRNILLGITLYMVLMGGGGYMLGWNVFVVTALALAPAVILLGLCVWLIRG